MGKHVFISYSRRDTEYVDRLVAYLTAGGVPVRVDHQLHYAEHWPKEIDGQIETCAAVVAVMTPDGQRSSWVGKELDLARQLGRPIVALLLSGEPFRALAGARSGDVTDVTDGTMPPPGFLHHLHSLATSSAPGGVYGAPRAAPSGERPSLLANLVTTILVVVGFAAAFGGAALTARALGFATGVPAAGTIWAVVGGLMIVGGLLAFLAGARRRGPA